MSIKSQRSLVRRHKRVRKAVFQHNVRLAALMRLVAEHKAIAVMP